MAKNTPLKYLISGMLLLILIVGCAPQGSQQGVKGTTISLDAGDNIKKAESKKELIEFLQKSSQEQSRNFGGGIRREFAMMDSAGAVAPMAKAAESSVSSQGSAGASDYSTTNIQVEGVDEADFVKNDGKYIYTIVQDKLVIINAYPAENAGIISETKLNGTPQQIFLNGDHLVVFVSNWEEVEVFSEFDFAPRPVGKSVTHAMLFDVSDRKNPQLFRDYNLRGNYYGSRMIGSAVYLIVQDYVNYANNYIDTPSLRESSRIIMQPDIFYFPRPQSSYNFNTIMSFDIQEDGVVPQAKTFMMGYASTLYVSENAMYLSSPKDLPFGYYEKAQEERFYSVVAPMLPKDAQDTISAIKGDDSLTSYEKWDKVASVLQDTYNSLSEEAKKGLMQNIEDALKEYDLKKEEERRRTIIHKIVIDDGKIEYLGNAEVLGSLLNQFSMDEKDGKLRVATTMETWVTDDFTQYNNVYVLNSNLKQVGSLEKIAPDERIYSTRFIGNRLYMVTFKRVDPFFVINLSSDQPKILGELKLPGFSDYLHPYDENHIIGIGKETADNEWGGVSTKGIKIALFDVSDVTNPKNQAVYGIGEAGTESEALHDHKAFLFDKKKNLLVLPIREIKGKPKLDRKLGYYTQDAWQGAYVLTLTLEDGFSLRGKVTHNEGEEQQWWYYSAPDAVRRALYIGDVLYTVSGTTIKANDLKTVKDIATIDLPYEEPQQDPYPIYKGGVMMGVSEPAVESDAPSLIDE